MNEQDIGQQTSQSKSPQPQPISTRCFEVKEPTTGQQVIDTDIDKTCRFMNPIVLDQEGKEAFFKLVERPAGPNQKLLSALRKAKAHFS